MNLGSYKEVNIYPSIFQNNTYEVYIIVECRYISRYGYERMYAYNYKIISSYLHPHNIIDNKNNNAQKT